jgi:hypothetical protein
MASKAAALIFDSGNILKIAENTVLECAIALASIQAFMKNRTFDLALLEYCDWMKCGFFDKAKVLQ